MGQSASLGAQEGSCAVVGDIFVDVMARVEGLPQWNSDTEASSVKVLPGGSALNQARHLQSLGTPVHFIGSVGDDAFGDTLTRHVTKQGFPFDHVKVIEGVPTSVCIVLSGPQDRAFVSCYSTTDAFSAADMKEKEAVIAGCTHLHVGGYFNMKGLQNPEFTAIVRKCKEEKLTVSLNVQYDATEKWTGEGGHLQELLPLVDILFVNEAEAQNLATALVQKQATPADLCQKFPCLMVAITKGKDGCELLRGGKPPMNVPCTPVETIVDTTGAGDAFIAGFLSVWIPHNQNLAVRADAQATPAPSTEASAGAAAPAAEPVDGEEILRQACVKGHTAGAVCVGREGACVTPVTQEDLNPPPQPASAA